jgi:hypothetical protein
MICLMDMELEELFGNLDLSRNVILYSLQL